MAVPVTDKRVRIVDRRFFYGYILNLGEIEPGAPIEYYGDDVQSLERMRSMINGFTKKVWFEDEWDGHLVVSAEDIDFMIALWQSLNVAEAEALRASYAGLVAHQLDGQGGPGTATG